MILLFTFLIITGSIAFPTQEQQNETDGETSRKVLGSSVVTSVSVILDSGNGSQAYFADAVGKPVTKPQAGSQVASPINLLNPDRYEFYTFDDNGDLIKRLMTLDEIQGIIANGDGDMVSNEREQQEPEKHVDAIVNNVQNVLKEEMETHKPSENKPILDTPDVSSTWSMILPAIFGNSGEDIKPAKPNTPMTPETIMLYDTATTSPPVVLKTTTTPKSTTKILTEKITTQQFTEPTTTIKEIPTTTLETVTTEKPIITTTYATTEKVKSDVKEETTELKTTFAENLDELKQMPLSTTTSSKPFSKPSENFANTMITKNILSTTLSQSLSSNSTPSTQPQYSSTEKITIQPKEEFITTTAKPITEELTTTTEKVATTTLPVEATNATRIQNNSTQQQAPSTLPIETTTSPLNKLEETTLQMTTVENSIKINELTTDKQNIEANKNSVTNQEVTTESIQTTEKLPVTPAENEQKMEIAEILNQLLLTTTNIYEINTELSKTEEQVSSNTTTSKPEVELKNVPEITTILNATETTEAISTTEAYTQTTKYESTIPEITTFEAKIIDSVPTESFMSTIEQLVSNASSQPAEVLNVASNSATVETVLEESKSKPMSVIQIETATVASQLLDSDQASKNDSLEMALNSLLSQITETESTTIEGTLSMLNVTTQVTTTTPQNVTEIPQNNSETFETSVKPIIAYKFETADESLNLIKQNYTTAENLNKSNVDIEDRNDTKVITEITTTTPVSSEQVSPSTPPNILVELKLSTLSENNVPQNTDTEDKSDINFDNTTTVQPSTEKTPSSSESTTLRIKETTVSLSTINMTDISTEAESKITQITETTNSTTTTTTTEKSVVNSTIPPVDNAEEKDSTWTLVSTVVPQKQITSTKTTPKSIETTTTATVSTEPSKPVNLVNNPIHGYGLEDSTSNLDTDVYRFVELCNELAFGFWKSVTNGISNARSVIISPFAATSLLAMVFLGARGATSGEMNEILKLDDMVTFNPHLIFKNVSESVENVGKNSGVAVSSIVRELYSDRSKGKLLSFYKERAKQFYDGYVEEVSFKEIGDIVRRRTNMIIKRQTSGKIHEYVKDMPINLRPPLAGVSASIFQTDCSAASTEGRDGELYFVVSPTIRQRKLVPVPAAIWRSNFLAGYDPILDATAVSIGMKEQIISAIYVLPGQQGIAAPGDGLNRLEHRLIDSAFKSGAWSRLLRTLIPRPGLEVQIPRFSHRSVINATNGLQRMGLKDLFDADKADLRGLNGVANELYLSDILQVNNFAMCAEMPLGDTHHSEIYPATAVRSFRTHRKLEMRFIDDDEPRDYQRAFHDPLHDPSYLSLPLSLRPRQARLPDIPRLRFDRPFLYFIRHNPTGLILHMGRFNPRLLP